MSGIGLLAAFAMFALVTVVAGMLPVSISGNALLAVLLLALLAAIAGYVTVEQAMSGVRR